MMKIIHRHQMAPFVLLIYEQPLGTKYRALIMESNGLYNDTNAKYLKEFLNKSYLDVAYLGYYELQSRHHEHHNTFKA